jgi:hypothetical protein
VEHPAGVQTRGAEVVNAIRLTRVVPLGAKAG